MEVPFGCSDPSRVSEPMVIGFPNTENKENCFITSSARRFSTGVRTVGTHK